MKLNKKFISDLDILKMPELIPLIEIDDRENFILMRAILRLFYGIKVNRCFGYKRDHKRMGFLIEYN